MPGSDAIFTNSISRGSNVTSRIICFPWSGGGTSVYTRWGRLLPDYMELTAVRLKGRESRYKEDVFATKEEIITEITDGALACPANHCVVTIDCWCVS